jgi:hypothetical protein
MAWRMVATSCLSTRRVRSGGGEHGGRVLEFVDERLEHEDDEKMGQHIGSGGGGAYWPVLDFGRLDALIDIAEFQAPQLHDFDE